MTKEHGPTLYTAKPPSHTPTKLNQTLVPPVNAWGLNLTQYHWEESTPVRSTVVHAREESTLTWADAGCTLGVGFALCSVCTV